MQTQTNKLTEFVWSLLFLFARYKVQGCLVNKLNLNSSHVHFWNMSLKNFVPRSPQTGRVEWDSTYTFEVWDVPAQNCVFPPWNFLTLRWADASRELIRKTLKGPTPQPFFKTGSWLIPSCVGKTRCSVKFSAVEIFGSFVIQFGFFHDSDVQLFPQA